MRNLATDIITTSLSKTRRIAAGVRVAWTKDYDDTITFAEVGTSLVDSADIVQGELDVLTEPDLYEYFNEDEFIIQAESERQVTEPDSSIAYSTGSFILNNTSRRFTPGVNGTIGDYILPKRPIKLFMGFVINGLSRLVPITYGVSKSPVIINNGNALQMQFFDFISYIQDFKLESDSVYVDQRTDQIIADILTTIGFSSGQFDLDEGFNTIEFAYFPKDSNAGQIIRELCQAELGYFYQDELGLLRFDNRVKYASSPYNAPVITLDESKITSIEDLPMSKIINSCKVVASPRAVANETEIWSLGSVLELAIGETKTIWADFNDPVTVVENIVVEADDFSTDLIANTALDNSGTDYRNDIGVTLTKFVKSTKIELENTSGASVFITKLRLRGTAAPVTNKIEIVATDTDSVDIYDPQDYTIENDFIDNREYAIALAKSIVLQYAYPSRRKKITIRGLPQLQVRDMVTLDIEGEEVDYRILRIGTSIAPGRFDQTLELREVTPNETVTIAIVGVSLVDGDDVII